ncbi:MAG TPA: phenylalanine--tRNA ligase subunit alpha [Candidatus Cybelea sp.]|jgi:phenylalanyl-tRNA synthetase alpha chain|nr:phenylalanine--tRNA ligase subunit alpha [Candidatus Cybelea sp.]
MTELSSQLAEVQERFEEAIAAARDERALESARVAYLGRSGEVTLVRRGIGNLSPAERPQAGRIINEAVAAMEAALQRAHDSLESLRVDAELASEIDVTFPSLAGPAGSIHPVRRIIEESCDYFTRHGFAVVVGAEAEPSYYNFDALNIPPEHPAREGFDSFWITGDLLLRPHTSPMQIRVMQTHEPPIAIVAPGKCYRRDAVDARHLFQFHQVEGLLVAEDINFGHLKGMLTGLCRRLFGPAQSVRFRPSYFPFTEPSAEVDTTCPKCAGEARQPPCNMCGGSGWIELGGAGMVHPNVLREAKLDPERYSGWAFGFGVERLGLARYGVDDIRRFIDSDADFLSQLS